MGRRGVGIYLMKNHEGYRYHDPTTGKAIRRAYRAKRRGKSTGSVPLTYKVGDLPGFPEILKCYYSGCT